MILPGTGRGTIRRRANGGGGASQAPCSCRPLRHAPAAGLQQGIHPIGEYVADFYVATRRLVIEVDGESHNMGDRPNRDAGRDRFMQQQGYAVFRIAAVDVLTNLKGVIAAIVSRVQDPLHHPADGPPPRSGEEC